MQQGATATMKRRPSELVNMARLEQRLDQGGFDAVVARAGINFNYLAGFAYPGTLARHVDLTDSPRGVFLVWPRRGEPHLVLNAIAEGLARRDSWVEHFDLYEGYVEPPVERLAKVLRQLGLDKGKVGFELNFLSLASGEALRRSLPHVSMVDATDLMDDVRAVKTKGEVALLKQGADLLDDAYLKHFRLLKPGMRERDLHAALVAECISRGCQFVHGILNSSRNSVPYAGESDFPFSSGDGVHTDYVAYLPSGYPGHQSRCAVVGSPDAEQRRRYRLIRDSYRGAIAECRVGRTAGDVYSAVAARFEAAGLPFKSMLAGHSVGCWWHQQEPVISRGNPRRLEEGMVIAMEPHVDHWHIQDMVVLGPGGPTLLSDRFSTDEIFACG